MEKYPRPPYVEPGDLIALAIAAVVIGGGLLSFLF